MVTWGKLESYHSDSTESLDPLLMFLFIFVIKQKANCPIVKMNYLLTTFPGMFTLLKPEHQYNSWCRPSAGDTGAHIAAGLCSQSSINVQSQHKNRQWLTPRIGRQEMCGYVSSLSFFLSCPSFLYLPLGPCPFLFIPLCTSFLSFDTWVSLLKKTKHHHRRWIRAQTFQNQQKGLRF